MNIHIFNIIPILIIFLCCSDIVGVSSNNTHKGKQSQKNEMSVLMINKLRSDKLNKSRVFHGKKYLLKRLGNRSLFLVNGITDVANRLGCDSNMCKSANRVLGKRSTKNNRLVSLACEAKEREK